MTSTDPATLLEGLIEKAAPGYALVRMLEAIPPTTFPVEQSIPKTAMLPSPAGGSDVPMATPLPTVYDLKEPPPPHTDELFPRHQDETGKWHTGHDPKILPKEYDQYGQTVTPKGVALHKQVDHEGKTLVHHTAQLLMAAKDQAGTPGHDVFLNHLSHNMERMGHVELQRLGVHAGRPLAPGKREDIIKTIKDYATSAHHGGPTRIQLDSANHFRNMVVNHQREAEKLDKVVEMHDNAIKRHVGEVHSGKTNHDPQLVLMHHETGALAAAQAGFHRKLHKDALGSLMKLSKLYQATPNEAAINHGAMSLTPEQPYLLSTHESIDCQDMTVDQVHQAVLDELQRILAEESGRQAGDEDQLPEDVSRYLQHLRFIASNPELFLHLVGNQQEAAESLDQAKHLEFLVESWKIDKN